MKITKKIEAEIRQVMEEYWSSYFNGDLEKFASVIDPAFKLIGTSETEVINGKAETMHWLNAQMEEMKGKAEFRDKRTELSAINDIILANEHANGYVLIDNEWKFYSKVRISTLLRQQQTGWKVVQQHGSLPDSRTGDGETLSFETLSRENLQLKEAVRRRTAELEIKTWELEIEAALERIRTKTMAMQKSDELKATSQLVFNELKELGKISTQISIGIFDEKNLVLNLYATLHGKQWENTSKVDLDEPLVMQKIYKGWKEKKKSILIDLSGKELKAYNRFRSQYSDLTFPDDRWVIHCAFFSKGIFSFSTTTPHDEQTMQLIERFAQVFDGTYTRFLDLQKAEEQASSIKLINQENERLLHSILPEQIAGQIRTGQRNIVKRFEQASILFADIVGFTLLSEKAKPSEVVNILNGLFSKFDDLTDQYHLEKIKTIGDAYMVAAGVPEEKEDHATVLFHFAQDMLRSVQAYNDTMGSNLSLRIGMSSGPVLAGVIGKKKFAYDLWGDSVNTAARMEAYGQAGKIQLSPESYELLKENYTFEKIPDVNIKGKGVMDVYLWAPAL